MNIFEILEKVFSYQHVVKEIEGLIGVKHNDDGISKYHLENDVYAHTFMVINYLKHKYGTDNIDIRLVLSSIFHDIGKKEFFTYSNGKKYFTNHWVRSGNIFRHLCLITNNFGEMIDNDDMLDIYKIIQLHHIKTNSVSKFIKNNFHKDLTLDTLKILDELNEADVNGRISIDNFDKERQSIINMFYDRQFEGYKPKKFSIDEFKKYIEDNLDKDKNTYFVVIPIGAPNSGKTSIFNTISSNIQIESIRKGFDDIRLESVGITKNIFEISNDEYTYAFENTDSNQLLPKLIKYFSDKLSVNTPKLFFIDNTNCTLKRRLILYNEFNKRFKRKNIKAKFIGLFFNTDLDTLYDRNKNRNYQVPNSIIRKMYTSINYPMKAEFDEIYFI